MRILAPLAARQVRTCAGAALTPQEAIRAIAVLSEPRKEAYKLLLEGVSPKKAKAGKAKGKVKFLKVDVDQSRELSGAHGVTSMPTLEFYRNGEKIATMVGANIVELKERVNRELMNPMLKLVSGKVAVGALLGAYLVLPWQRILAN